MSTVNGFGTLYYGWKSLPDNTAEATKWVVFAFFPVVPVRRHHLHVQSSGQYRAFSLFGGGNFKMDFEILESMPLDWRSVAKTYLWGYLGVPVLLGIPLAIMFIALRMFAGPNGLRETTPTQEKIRIVGVITCFIYWAVVVARILDGASGRLVAQHTPDSSESIVEAELDEDFV